LRYGIEADAGVVLDLQADAVVIATGALPGVPAIRGIDDAPVVDAFSVLRTPRGNLRRVLVIGGGMLGVALAHALAGRTEQVVVVEPGNDLSAELGVRPRWQFVANLRARTNVAIHTGTTVEAVMENRALLHRAGEDFEIGELDLIVPARPMVSRVELGDALKAVPGGPAIFDIGDCVTPRTAFEALQEAAALGHRL